MKNTIFIFGMPRSGTKLIRDLLNNHPLINIPNVESHFIPFFHKRFNPKTDKLKLLEEFKKTSYYINMQENGHLFDESFFINEVADNWHSIFSFFLSYYIDDLDNIKYIGDKTPGYINHIELISKLFPDAKFIHIYRDPREYALSVKNAWNKSIYIAAQRWERSIVNFDHIKNNFNHIELTYEELISTPIATLKKLCKYLNLEFNKDMLTLKQPSENLGAAKGSYQIESNNSQKYKQFFNKKQIKKIEELTYNGMQNKYNPIYGTNNSKLSKFEFLYYSFKDLFNSISFHINEKGNTKGIKYFISLHKRSSWRD